MVEILLWDTSLNLAKPLVKNKGKLRNSFSRFLNANLFFHTGSFLLVRRIILYKGLSHEESTKGSDTRIEMASYQFLIVRILL